jgi:hypothetical protein
VFAGTNVILVFPDLDTFKLALICGAVPASVSVAGVDGAVDADGRMWLKPSVPLDAPSLDELRHLDVHAHGREVVTLDLSLCCWPQLLPLQRDPRGWSQADPTPILFELPDTSQLPELVGEMLRLGNDRQSFRWIDTGEGMRALLRVVGPPYYSVLRALDSGPSPATGAGPSDHTPRAYRELAPRVWVQLGYTHPLAKQIEVPAGQILLMSHPRHWVFVDEGRFRDIYEVLDFSLPQAQAAWRETELEHRITIPLRLAPGGSTTEPAELWVLHDDALVQLDRFVQDADDQLLARLIFAVGEDGDRKTIVLRVRPSKLPPPVLVLDGVGFRRHLRLPNLFLPCGRRLHPPLRRDAVAKLLAADAGQVTWLYPLNDGRFSAESLPDDAFRPLSDWIDYILDQDHHALTAWVQANRFAFESFICPDDQTAAGPPPKDTPRPKAKRGREKVDDPGEPAEPEPVRRSSKRDVTVDEMEGMTQPSELDDKLRRLETMFLEMKGAPDAPERQGLWLHLAQVHGALGHADEAAICWSNAVWELPAPPSSSLDLWRHDALQPPARRIAEIVAKSSPSHADLRGLVLLLVRQAHEGAGPDDRPALLGPAQRFLAEHEGLLGIRLAWLGWEAVNRLADGDVLALARARDRLLERLYLTGLSADLDLPGFLRLGGVEASARFHRVRNEILRLLPMVHRWLAEGHLAVPGTGVYADLLFAFGLARIGEKAHSHKLIEAAPRRLVTRDQVHWWLIEAFEFRIRESLEGRAGVQRLRADLLDRLEAMDHLARYKIDRLREHSRILEPHEQVDPYRLWHRRFADDLSRELASLHDIKDGGELTDRLRRLLHPPSKGKVVIEPRILITALELAPRLGEEFAAELLEQAARILEKLADPLDQALLLEKGLFVAAHYDEKEAVQHLVGRFHRLIEAGGGSLPVRNLEALLGGSFRSLRKLGLRDEVGLLLERMARVIANNPEPHAGAAGASTPASQSEARLQRLLLQVATGWFFFGQDERARPILDRARTLLFKGDLIAVERTALACAYVTTLGQAPLELALARILELFRKLKGVHDTFTTCSHYSLSRLDVIEAVVSTLVSHEFTVAPEARRWLDEDEFLVRRRIHREVRAAMEKAGL